MSRLWCAALAALALCLVPASLYAQDADEPAWAHAQGLAYARTYTMIGYSPANGPLPAQDLALVVERLRLSGELYLGEWVYMEGGWDVLPIIGASQTIGSLATPTGGAQRLVDFDAALYSPSAQTWTLRHNLDRLFVRVGDARFMASVGRQALNHGSARMFPGSDLFAPFSPGTIDTEFKRGVDALRLTWALDDTQELEFLAVANGTDAARSLYFMRWRKSFELGMDLSILAGMSYATPTLAVDVTGDLWGATWYVDSTARLNADLHDEAAESMVRATAGLSYQLELGLNLTVEAHYNSLGGAPPYADALYTPGVVQRAGEVVFLAPYYAGLGLGYTLSPLTQLGLSYIQNLRDGSGLVSANLAYDFAQEVSMGLSILAPIGARPSLDLAAQRLKLESEFGAFPFLAITDLRFVF